LVVKKREPGPSGRRRRLELTSEKEEVRRTLKGKTFLKRGGLNSYRGEVADHEGIRGEKTSGTGRKRTMKILENRPAKIYTSEFEGLGKGEAIESRKGDFQGGGTPVTQRRGKGDIQGKNREGEKKKVFGQGERGLNKGKKELSCRGHVFIKG